MADFWKDKKILAYIALKHHTRFITPVMNRLADEGARIHYVVGQAERSQEITAIECGLEYSHVFDYLTDRDSDEITKNYLAMRNKFGTILTQSHALENQLVTITDKTIYSTAAEYTAFKKCLIREKPDLCLALHELNRWGKMFSFHAKKLNIPVVTMQEGMYYGLDFCRTGHVQNSTLTLVWGKSIKKKLACYEAPAQRIIPVGNTHLSHEMEYQKKNRIREKKRALYHCSQKSVILLLFSAVPPSVKELLPLFESANSRTKTKLFIKFHPVTTCGIIDAWSKSLPRALRSRMNLIHGEESTYDLISMADLCVLAAPSTTGLEAMAFGKPVVLLTLKADAKQHQKFSDNGAVLLMSPQELASAIIQKKDFTAAVSPSAVKKYLSEILEDPTGVLDRAILIFKKMIRANKKTPLPPINQTRDPEKSWSIILPVTDSPANLLKQLETIAMTSENQGKFEIILLKPTSCSKRTTEILNSLRGDVTTLTMDSNENMVDMMNRAGRIATGEQLIFLDKALAPVSPWLEQLDIGIKKYGKDKILGAKISDTRGGILHAGMVMDENHGPVSAYEHIRSDFPQAVKERPFKLLDQFICISTVFFHLLGGFWPKAGHNLFMDICLRAEEYTKKNGNCIYLPKVHLVRLDLPESPGPWPRDDEIYFYSRWHGSLWHNRTELYLADKVTQSELDAARMDQAMRMDKIWR